MTGPDPCHLSRWFSAYTPALVLYARQWLEAARAEEIVQDAFLRIMSQRHVPENVKAWLFTAVRNAAISEIRSQRRRHKQTQRAMAETPTWFCCRPDESIDAATAQEALTALPAEQREVIVLRIWAGMTLQEISQVTRQPVSTLFSRYKAGLAELRKRMESPCGKKKD
jgi:RNA polymerase sigma factor (sigma-70 family)